MFLFFFKLTLFSFLRTLIKYLILTAPKLPAETFQVYPPNLPLVGEQLKFNVRIKKKLKEKKKVYLCAMVYEKEIEKKS